MSDDLESTDVVMMCCASCGKAEVDDVNSRNAAANSFDIAPLNVSGIIGRNTKRRARNGWLNYVMIGCLRSPMRAILESVQSAVCRCRLIKINGG
jgi:hypothetical protein